MNQPIGALDNAQPTLVLSPVWYDRLRLLVQVILPGIGALYFGLAGIWGLPKAEQVVGTAAVLAVFLGLILGVSRRRYEASDAKFDGVIVPQVDAGGVRAYSMELNGDPEDLQYQKEVRFKVSPDNV